MQAGDRVSLPGSRSPGRVDSVLGLPGIEANASVPWPEPRPGVRLDALDLGPEPASIKLYLPTTAPAQFAVMNEQDATSLRGRYGPLEALPFLGVWVSRGGWNGYHHFAIEPTNVNSDRADAIDPSQASAAVIPPGETRRWFVEWAVGRSLTPDLDLPQSAV
jgi:hypothetical protein